MHTDRKLLGITLMLLFCTVAPMIDVSAKLAAATIPVGQITAARFVVQAALMAPIVALLGLSFRVSGLAIWLMFMRAVCLIAST